MLTARRETVLGAIVDGYIDTVTPIGSQHIVKKWGLSLSPATIRAEMSALEDEGYITRPHTSAGGVPTDRGYRYYVERFTTKPTLAPREKGLIRQQFVKMHMDQERWARMAAAALPKLTGNLAISTAPKAAQVRLKQLELVPVQDFLVMMLVVLWETKILREVVSLERAVSRQELIRVSNKLSDLFEGVTSSEMAETDTELTPLEEEVARLTKNLMEEEERRHFEDPLFEGIQQLFEQPELSEAEILRDVMEILEEEGYLKGIVEQVYSGPGVQVGIGGEVTASRMRHFSLIIAEYGISDRIKGVVGVLGPKRMAYRRNIPAVQYLARLMSSAVEEAYSY